LFPADPILTGTLSNPDQLYNQLGTFWRDYLEDAELLRKHTWADLQVNADVYLRAIETASAGSIQTIKPFVARQWRLIRLLESELTLETNMVRYGSGRTYGDGLVYGQIESQPYAWQLAADIRGIGILVDQILDPDHVFDASTFQFDPKTQVIRFTQNPFELLPRLPIYDSTGAVVDHQVLLWARNVQQDENLPFLRYGAVLGIHGQSSEAYCKTLLSAWSMLVQGPSIADLQRGILGSVGLQDAVGDETVELIEVDDEGLAIVTDKRVYRAHADATPLVTVGDALEPGQLLVDTVQVFECSSGSARPYSSLPGLSVGSNSLVFPNVDETFQFDTETQDVRFTVYGDQAAVEAFWAQTHQRGLDAGKLLAEWVGVDDISDEVAVNPLKFMVENIVGQNLIVVVVKPEHFLGFEPGFLTRIQTLLPAGTLLVVQSALQPVDDLLNLTETSDASATVYDAIQAPTETMDTTGPGLTYTDFDPVIMVN
jgi:hypothetical protein